MITNIPAFPVVVYPRKGEAGGYPAAYATTLPLSPQRGVAFPNAFGITHPTLQPAKPYAHSRLIRQDWKRMNCAFAQFCIGLMPQGHTGLQNYRSWPNQQAACAAAIEACLAALVLPARAGGWQMPHT